ncbi:MAG: bifunctional phosphoribosyl-AMP cyclohydrolase/phosphoribosyl-ATP diphosphatase HisIE [Alphaproteobacteria bacterium]|nr:bifunctional phosphoribosyl-AMP cyclohydrolase/phosphoribosyl-ATP diphosphatase HisIE [Alphaproteobacteria bacterium]
MTQDFTSVDISAVDWAKSGGLVPVIVQDAASFRVLMLGYMNSEALSATLTSGFVTFFSRSKNRLWQKGETSGNVLRLREIRLDCDNDALLALVDPTGPTCHTGSTSCFGEMDAPALAILSDLENTIRQRQANPTENSYTAALFAKGLPRIAQKVGEEGVEVALAGALSADNLAEESADLLYHLLVLLVANGKGLSDALNVLKSRTK